MISKRKLGYLSRCGKTKNSKLHNPSFRTLIISSSGNFKNFQFRFAKKVPYNKFPAVKKPFPTMDIFYITAQKTIGMRTIKPIFKELLRSQYLLKKR